jgi:hypothetical protein
MLKRILIAAVLVLVGTVAGWLLVRAPSPWRTTGGYKWEAAGVGLAGGPRLDLVFRPAPRPWTTQRHLASLPGEILDATDRAKPGDAR